MIKIFCVVLFSVQALAGFLKSEAEHDMTLTPGDLKRFSGHLFNLVERKCPNVNHSTLFELNRFIAKAIAKDSDPVAGDDKTFQEVINSIRICAMNSEPKPKTEETRVPDLLVTRVRGLKLEKDGDQQDAQVKADTKASETVSSTSSNSDFGKWISNIFMSIRKFFHNFFGIARFRRSADHLGMELNYDGNKEDKGKAAFVKLLSESCRIYCHKCSTYEDVTPSGIRMASKELLNHLFKIVPEQGIQLAASHHLTHEFMESIEECE